jgi:hypothetical protein
MLPRAGDTEVEFTLRDDIAFHDGQRLTPEGQPVRVRRTPMPAS